MFSEENFLAAHMGFNGNLRDQDGKKLGAGGGGVVMMASRLM